MSTPPSPGAAFASMRSSGSQHRSSAASVNTPRCSSPTEATYRSSVPGGTTSSGRRSLPLVEVETDAVVPADLVSNKTETAARTIRPKIMRELDRFVVELRTTALDVRSHADTDRSPSLPPGIDERPRIDLDDLDSAVEQLGVPAEPAPVEEWKGGTTEAHRLLTGFLEQVLPAYATLRNRYDEEPSSSRLSPYLPLRSDLPGRGRSRGPSRRRPRRRRCGLRGRGRRSPGTRNQPGAP